MKTSKKILYICLSLAITSAISGGLSLGVELFLALSFWKSFFFFSTAQLIIPFLWSKYYETANLLAYAKEYASKPFKEYRIGLNCAHCGHSNKVEVNLVDTEFKCTNCGKDNGIHVEFMTAAITEPMSDTNFL